MTRKIAVTVFAMSLALVGCGSSSATKVDAGGDAKLATPDGSTVDAVALDVVAPTGIEAGQAADLAQQTDVTTLPPDAGIVPTDTAPADVASVPDGGAAGKDLGSLAPDASPVDTGKPDGGGGADVQHVQSDVPPVGGDVGPSINHDAAGTDAAPNENPDAPNSGIDAPPSVPAPDAAEEAGSDVLASVIADAAEDAGIDVEPSVAPDAAEDVVTSVDTIAAEVEVEAGSSAVDGGGDDGSTD